MGKLLLSISILVSNRIDTVEKTLKSVKNIMDRVPSELIVVDTVGEEKSDGSLEIAKQYATKLVHFDWINDFAAARNAGLKEADGEWFMFLDDDEEFIEIDDLVEFFLSEEHKKYQCATYKLHDYTDNEGHYVVSDMQRMTRLFPETIFKGRIHEYVSPMRLPVKELNSYADHHGYVFESPEDKLKKFNRNWPLLLEEFKENPHDIRIRLHLIQACIDTEGYVEKADEFCRDTLFGSKDWLSDRERSTSYYQWIMCAYVRIATKSDDHAEIMKRVDEMRCEPVVCNLLRLALAVMDSKSAKTMNLPERALTDLRVILNEYNFLTENPETLFFQKELDLGLFIETEYILASLHYGISVVRDAGFFDVDDKKAICKEAFVLYRKLKNKPFLTVLLRLPFDEENLEKSFHSVIPLKERLNCNIIAVSFGKNDDVAKHAERYANEVLMSDDSRGYSYAANEGLSKANSEWLLYLEDGAWISDPEPIADFFEKAEYIDYASACLKMTVTNEKGEKAGSLSDYPFMVRLSEEIHFENVINEELRPFNLPCKYIDAEIAKKRVVTDKTGKPVLREDRDLGLLERAYNEQADSLEAAVQYADITAKRDGGKGLELSDNILSEFSDQYKSPYYQFMISVFFRLCESQGISVLQASGKYSELQSGNLFIGYAQCAAAYEMTRLCLINDMAGKAVSYVNDYFRTYDIISDTKESEKERMKGDLGSFTESVIYNEMTIFGINILAGVGDIAGAWELVKRIPWDNSSYKSGADALALTFYINSVEERPIEIFEIIKKVMKNPAFIVAFSNMVKTQPNIKQAVDRCLASVGTGGERS